MSDSDVLLALRILSDLFKVQSWEGKAQCLDVSLSSVFEKLNVQECHPR